jgi:hypothetical protein
MSSLSSAPSGASDARLSLLHRFGAWQDYLLLSALFIATRIALYALGLRFKLVLDWMFLADLADLRERLWETIYYFHAFPPGWNLLTGILLKISPDHVAGMAHALFVASGLLMVNSLLYLARVVGVPRWAALAMSFAFAIIPPTLYFENLYLYDYPVPALLTFAAALFHRALVQRSFALWFGVFAVCTLLGLLRSALHLVWFLAILGASLWLVRDARRKILLAAAAPAAVLLLLYTKNWLVFGVFDSQSQSGGNAMLITTYHMPRGLRKAWVQQGKLSPFADMRFAAPPRDFLPYFNTTENERWPQHQLTELERPSNGAPNYNHWFFLEVNQWRRQDALYCLSHRPRQYIRTVFGRSLPQAFSPSTLWHPYSGKPSSPHYEHQQVLGGYEDAYNTVVHRLFLAPVGFYIFFPLCLGWIIKSAWPLLRSAREEERAVGALWYFCVLQILYLVAVIALLTWGENARYRYIIEPLIWLVSARSVVDLVRRARVELHKLRPALAARSTEQRPAL